LPTGNGVIPNPPIDPANPDRVPFPDNTVDNSALDELREELYDVVGDLGLKLEDLTNQLRLAANALPPPTSTPSPETPAPAPLPTRTTPISPDLYDTPYRPTGASNFHDRVNKVQKACESAKKVEGGEFKGMEDPRSLMVWAQSVKQAPLYQFGDPITRYFFVLHNLSDSVESNVLCAIDLERGGTTEFNCETDFDRHLEL
ncbi:Casein kinase I isoform delta, partial [Perkinsus chesapeaki]